MQRSDYEELALVAHDGELALCDGQGTVHATIHPLQLDTSAPLSNSGWQIEPAAPSGAAFVARGSISYPGGQIKYSLELAPPTDPASAPLRLDWHVSFSGEPLQAALIHAVTLPGLSGDPSALDLPTLHYAGSNYGHGIFPHPEPAQGFSFRADRMGQPAIHYSTAGAMWSYFAASEAPEPPAPGLLYSLGMAPTEGGLELFFRYPQYEYGQRGDGGLDAYIAKSTWGEGENLRASWADGDQLHKMLYLWRRAPEHAHDYGAVARYLWRLAYPTQAAPPGADLWRQAGEHIRWYNARLYNPAIGGGQYESPEGSGTAMLGFVEQSLSMAATTYRYALLSENPTADDPARSDLAAIRERAAGALTRWASSGLSPEGLLYPVCDGAGYSFGYRDYSDYKNLSIVRDEAFDVIRLTFEAHNLLAAAQAARLGNRAPDAGGWQEAALSVAEWLLAHPLPAGGYAPRYSRTGEPLELFPAGTGAAIGLFCECARLPGPRRAAFRQAAEDAYEQVLAANMRAGIFAGGTLDASTPDREAAIADLGACLNVYELTGDERYLAGARAAADNILSYTLVYPISTFEPGTDAYDKAISTFGATIVSPENQHLDPVSTSWPLLRYGLYAADPVCVQAAAESLKWCLDGRWAIREQEGLKQSEQLLNTRWYYNTFFAQRGDFRRGMPLWGRSDSEHGWPQVVPSAELLHTGEVILDWATSQGCGLSSWQISEAAKQPDGSLALRLDIGVSGPALRSCLLKVLRVPASATLRIGGAGDVREVSGEELAAGCMLRLPAAEVSLTLTLLPGAAASAV